MGIPSYFSYLVRKHRQIIKTIQTSPPINNLYLDCNSFIYEAFYNLPPSDNLTSEAELIKMTCDNIGKVIKLLKPSDRVYIAFDGVAPLAKLNQQRNRRYMAAFQKSLLEPASTPTPALDKWNTAAITPGTAFMTALGQAVATRFAHPAEFGVTQLMVSSAEEPGEGEHKIYAYIRAEAAAHQATTTVIYGLDADLIMLTINHLHIGERMYLFRETPEFIKSIDKTLNPGETYLLDIPLFARTMIKELDARESKTPVAAISLQNEVLYDYIFMCFFLGNDFLPHFPALNIRTNGINKLLEAYKTVFSAGETLTQHRHIVWKNVRKFIGYLAQNERGYMQTEYAQREKASKYAAQTQPHESSGGGESDPHLLLPLKERSVEIYINPYETGWEKRYYTALFNLPGDPTAAISLNYLTGLEWTMKYYSVGCADWRWQYNYYYPPLLTDLLKQVPYLDREFVVMQPAAPVDPLVQLSYVLPPSSMHLLPPGLHAKLLQTKPEWYVGNYTFVWAFCKFFWEAHVDLPTIDMTELEGIVLAGEKKNLP